MVFSDSNLGSLTFEESQPSEDCLEHFLGYHAWAVGHHGPRTRSLRSDAPMQHQDQRGVALGTPRSFPAEHPLYEERNRVGRPPLRHRRIRGSVFGGRNQVEALMGPTLRERKWPHR